MVNYETKPSTWRASLRFELKVQSSAMNEPQTRNCNAEPQMHTDEDFRIRVSTVFHPWLHKNLRNEPNRGLRCCCSVFRPGGERSSRTKVEMRPSWCLRCTHDFAGQVRIFVC